jgi:hypothetical protein
MSFSLFCDLEGRKYRREDPVDPVVIRLNNSYYLGGEAIMTNEQDKPNRTSHEQDKPLDIRYVTRYGQK